MENLLVETLESAAFTMMTVFLMFFHTGLMMEMGISQINKQDVVLYPWHYPQGLSLVFG